MIETKLRELLAQLSPLRIDVSNDSHLHGNSPESGTHFKVVLVSESFSGLSRVKRHQLVYGICSELLQNPIHALALHLYSPDEDQGQNTPQSIACGGGDGRL